MGSGLTFFGCGSSHEQQPVVTDSDSLSWLNKSSKACKMAETCTQDWKTKEQIPYSEYFN